MIYGAARLMGVPWETIFKSYRSQLKEGGFNYLNEYVQDFANYLANNELIFPSSLQLSYAREVILNLMLMIRSKTRNDV